MGKEKDLKLLKNELDDKFSTLSLTEICDFICTNNGKTYSCRYIDIMKKNLAKALEYVFYKGED